MTGERGAWRIEGSLGLGGRRRSKGEVQIQEEGGNQTGSWGYGGREEEVGSY